MSFYNQDIQRMVDEMFVSNQTDNAQVEQEAEETWYGSYRKDVTDWFEDNITHPYAQWREQSDINYIKQCISREESISGIKLTGDQKQVRIAQSLNHFKEYDQAQQIVHGIAFKPVADFLDLAGHQLEYGLKMGGMPRGQARAWHTGLNDFGLVIGATSLTTSALRSTLRSTACHVSGAVVRGTVSSIAIRSSTLASAAIPTRSAVLTNQHTLMQSTSRIIGLDLNVRKAQNISKPNQHILHVNEQGKIYITYEKPHPHAFGQTGVKGNYVGRTSGLGDIRNEQDIRRILMQRDRNHHMNKKGFERAKIDEISTNPLAIRGREQMKIDQLGGAQSQGGTSGNAINSIRLNNPNLETYLKAAQEEFKTT